MAGVAAGTMKQLIPVRALSACPVSTACCKCRSSQSELGLQEQKRSWLEHCPAWNKEGEESNVRFAELVRQLEKTRTEYKEVAAGYVPFRDIDCARMWDDELPGCKRAASA